jgi:hypothetical protein
MVQKTLLLGICVAAAVSAHGQSITAVAKLENVENEILVDLRRDDAQKLDEYGKITSNNEKARLDNTFISLNNRPDAQLYVVMFGKTAAVSKAAKYRVSRYAVQRGMDLHRFTFVTRSGNRDPKTQIWLVPAGATPPI